MQIGKLLISSHKLSKELLEVGSNQIAKLIEVAGESGVVHQYKLIGNSWGGNILFWLPKQHE